MANEVKVRREYEDWKNGTVQIGDGPEIKWSAKNSREAIERVHRVLGEHGLNPKEPDNVTWHHATVPSEKKEDE